MSQWEFKVVHAPTKGTKARGVKGPEGRFAQALETLMNDLGREGWEYQRADTLPSIERAGLTGSTTEWRNVLVFRRLRENDAEAFAPELLPAPAPEKEAAEMPVEAPAKKVEPAVEKPKETVAEKEDDADKPAVDKKVEAAKDEEDNGVEDTGDISVISSSLGKLAEARKLSKSDT